MRKCILLSTSLLVALALSLTATSAVAAGGRLQLNLVNSGPSTAFYNESITTDGNCSQIAKPASLSTGRGTSVQFDSPGYRFETDTPAHPSVLSYVVPAGGRFTIPANPNALMFKIWAYSGDGTCGGQLEDQRLEWRVDCSGPTCGSASLTGGWQSFAVPAGTPVNTLFNVHFARSSAVAVGAGDTISLQLSADTWVGMQWSARNGPGASYLSILTR